MDVDNSKPWYLSRGVIGSGVAIAAGVASVFHFQIDGDLQSSVTDWLLSGGALVGGTLALYGRLKASRKIG